MSDRGIQMPLFKAVHCLLNAFPYADGSLTIVLTIIIFSEAKSLW